MLIRDVMTRDVVAVRPGDNLRALVEKFVRHNFHTLPVVDDGGKVKGVVAYEDMMKIFVPHNPALQKLLKSTHFYNVEEEDILEADLPEDLGETLLVEDIMETDFVAVDEKTPLSKARLLMKQHDTEWLLAVKEGKLSGFITLFDIIVAVFRARGITE